MNDLANLGVAAHWIYKDNISQKDGKQFKGLSQILDILDQTGEPEEFWSIQNYRCIQIKFLFLLQAGI